MARRTSRLRMSPAARTTTIKIAASVAAFGVLIGGAIVAQGFDVKQTPLNDSSIWALQSGTLNKYARINTDLGELETVKSVGKPSELAQTTSSLLVVSQGKEKVTNVSLSQPEDIDSDSDGLQNAPSDTQQVVTTGDYIGYRTGDGHVYVAAIADGANTANVDPYIDDEVPEGQDPKEYVATAIALGYDEKLYSFSADEKSVLTYDIATGKIETKEPVSDLPAEATPSLTVVGSSWVLYDPITGALFTKDHGPDSVEVEPAGVLQQATESGDGAFIASDSGLTSYELTSGDATEEYEGSGLGIPAAPTPLDGILYAAWTPTGAGNGTLWSQADGVRELDYAGKTLEGELAPALRTNGSRMILNETLSGWVWSVPTGDLIKSSQDWTLGIVEQETPDQDPDEASEVLDAKPPIAVSDSFGVRAGEFVTLPVLLNDHDPNTDDVLTVVPDSLGGLSADFGTVETANNNSSVVVRVSPKAKGTATFSYTVTDGSRPGGLVSLKAATVTLTVRDAGENSAPVWCVKNCQVAWPVPEVEPGGSVTVPVLGGWFDPDGDPFYVKSAVKREADKPGKVAVTPDGSVVYQHPNSAGAIGAVAVTVTVADSRGKTAEKLLVIRVTADPSLEVAPFAVTTRSGEPVTIDPRKHISGIAGSYSITSASTGTDDGSKAALNDGATSFTFTAKDPGDYLVGFTVKDSRNDVIGTVRVTVLKNAEIALSTTPVTVFVRQKLDTTVDVFSAVTNPGGKVLLINEALSEQEGASSLDVNIVDHRLLRVKGSTPDGTAGVVGRVVYTITDGTGTKSANVTGVATVIMLPSAVAQAPIAINDTVTVRAGAQVDIPVLANDVAADGSSMVLNPEALKNSAKRGLAFTAGSSVRYLAPEKAGKYRLSYGVYSAGTPDVSDTAEIQVTVLARGDNRAPQPKTLVGRVFAGETVSIPFERYGLDPDGDAVILERIKSQPDSGIASISEDGDAINYASVAGFSGPVDFSYSVKDAGGKTATASVRVGVLDDQTDPTPVTFSDYVEVQLGADNFAEVFPASNDIDPGGSTLTVTSVVPDAVKGKQEYQELLPLIGKLGKNGVKLNAGTTLGTKVFQYTVQNAAKSSSATGYIVMKVVREAVPDSPKVTDSYVTLADRASFAEGIDVVSGKVSWLSGDLTKLTLSLYDADSPFTVDGVTIKGELPDKGAVVPFTLTGVNYFGTTVTTHAFLTVPGRNDIIIAVVGDATQKVKEKQSVRFDVAKLVALPRGETLAVSGKKFATTKTRAAATCTLVSGTNIEYSAGEGDPYTDTCTVPVRLQGQTEFTSIPVPIVIEPENPEPVLHPASITQSPGAEAITYDLALMTTWEGAHDSSQLKYKAEYSGGEFEVSLDDSRTKLIIVADDLAKVGRVEKVSISLPDFTSKPTVLSVKVGPAPTTVPSGATVSTECTAKQNGCVTKVVGVRGEGNIWDEPLTLDKIVTNNSCSDVKFSKADDSSIRASYDADVAGGICVVSFSVRDVRGLVSSGERNGTLTIDLKGFPRAPAQVTQIGYGDGTVDLKVDPDKSGDSYPSITGFDIRVGSKTVTTCDKYGACGRISKLVNGDDAKKTYQAYARNSLGLSRSSVQVVAWAYANPALGDISMRTIYSERETTRDRGVVEVAIENTDKTIKNFVFSWGNQSQVIPRQLGQSQLITFPLGVGERNIQVKAESRFRIPEGVGDEPETKTQKVTIAGRPSINDGGSDLTSTSDSITINGVSTDRNYSRAGETTKYIAYRQGPGFARCDTDRDGNLVVTTNGVVSDGPRIGGLDPYGYYTVVVCYSNGFGAERSRELTAQAWEQPSDPNNYHYKVVQKDGVAGKFVIQIVPGDQPENERYFTTVYTPSDNPDYLPTGQDPGIRVKFCLKTDGRLCSREVAVTPETANRAWQVSIAAGDVVGCVWGEAPRVIDFRGDAVLGTGTQTQTYVDIDGNAVALVDGKVPANAVTMKDLVGTWTWTADAVSGLEQYTWSQATQACRAP